MELEMKWRQDKADFFFEYLLDGLRVTFNHGNGLLGEFIITLLIDSLIQNIQRVYPLRV